ncbi:MAG: PEP/pyruvate-binding domain-containing protein [Alphaproteobacteria bacterium]|nr:PEP/pyruvate-binding domain-containing protein [Alphaproteobacteria bacterium]
MQPARPLLHWGTELRFILWPDEIEPDSPVGGKARALASLTRAGLPVPAWFVIRPDAFAESRPSGAPAASDGANAAPEIGSVLQPVSLAAEIERELDDALATLCPNGELTAVRSSALEEDSALLSFAGQLESYVFVAPEDVARRVSDVWRSGFTDRILAYRREAGLDRPRAAPAVIVQRVIEGEVSGVAFSADPVSGRRSVAVVTAVWGHAAGLVSGEAQADTWHVDGQGRVLDQAIAPKRVAYRRDPDAKTGLKAVPVAPERTQQASIDQDTVAAVAGLARRAERHFGRPQDIEWTIQGGQLYLLQSRPITTLADKADPDGLAAIWDNANIVENYAGVVTPLTFSFVRHVYKEVYRDFCRLMGLPNAIIEENGQIFRGMVGLVRGRIYYNLLNWYRLLALLPAFQSNRTFLDQMLGIGEVLPRDVVTLLTAASRQNRATGAVLSARVLVRLLLNLVLVNRHNRRFVRRLEETLGPGRPDLSGLRPDALAAHYRRLEGQLVQDCGVPALNDFYVMAFHGVLRKLINDWVRDDVAALHNDLFCGDKGVISVALAGRVRHMADLAAKQPGLTSLLCEGSQRAIEAEIGDHPDLDKAYRDYLETFGDRCIEELKLESPALYEDPLPLLRSVGHVARRRAGRSSDPPDPDRALRSRAERVVRSALGRNIVKRAVFAWVLRRTRARLRDRETLRFARTRVFARVRQISLELGKRYAALDLLADARDIFYLNVGEMLGFVEGWATTTDLKALVAVRKREYRRYQAEDPPADRFQSTGIVYLGQQSRARAQPCGPDGDALRGIGCCPGTVVGPARLIRDPRRASILPGEIIVAERTDPGWTMIFPAAAGLLVERGNLLSHSAIVAREMGLPMIVSVPGLTQWLKDGDRVEMDGGTGHVAKLAPGDRRDTQGRP